MTQTGNLRIRGTPSKGTSPKDPGRAVRFTADARSLQHAVRKLTHARKQLTHAARQLQLAVRQLTHAVKLLPDDVRQKFYGVRQLPDASRQMPDAARQQAHRVRQMPRTVRQFPDDSRISFQRRRLPGIGPRKLPSLGNLPRNPVAPLRADVTRDTNPALHPYNDRRLLNQIGR